MIISRNTGLRLIREGKARAETVMVCNTQSGDKLFVALTRYDKQRTDHFPSIYKDQQRLPSASKNVEDE